MKKWWMRWAALALINTSTATALVVGAMVGREGLDAYAFVWPGVVLLWSALLAGAVEWVLLEYFEAVGIRIHNVLVEGKARDAMRALESGRLDDVKLILAEFRTPGNGVQWERS